MPEHLRGDVMYAPSHHSGGGSTLRITARKTHSPDRLNTEVMSLPSFL